MFSIIETLHTYFAHELLPDCLSSDVTLHFNTYCVFIQRLQSLHLWLFISRLVLDNSYYRKATTAEQSKLSEQLFARQLGIRYRHTVLTAVRQILIKTSFS